MDTALESIKLLPQQISQAWQETRVLSLPKSLKNLDRVAISGMGGSIYNAYFLESVFKQELRQPVLRINNYGLPGFINNKTLFIASSYSGSTEEVIFNLKEAASKQVPSLVIANGGRLLELSKSLGISSYKFSAKYNPSDQPRMGQGYMLFAVLGVLVNLGYLNINISKAFLDGFEQKQKSLRNQAQELAEKLLRQELFFVAADHLSANAHILRNQTNETAKLYANYNLIPELNHHLMEGLKHPENRNRAFVFLDSKLYQKRNQERIQLTKTVIKKNGFPVFGFTPQSNSVLGQFIETLIWGGYLTYELGRKYQEEPNLIPWVDYFKNQLGKF